MRKIYILFIVIISVFSFNHYVLALDELLFSEPTSLEINWQRISSYTGYEDKCIIATGETGLRIMDFTNGEDNSLLATIEGNITLTTLCESTNTLYTYDTDERKIKSFSLETPLNPVLLGEYSPSYYSGQVWMDLANDSLLVVATSNGLIRWLDVSDNSNLSLTTSIQLEPLLLLNIDINNHLLAYQDSEGNLIHFLDFSDLSSPSLVGEFTLNSGIDSYVFYGDTLFLASQTYPANLQVIDLSTPESPAVLYTQTLDFFPTDMEILDDKLFIINSSAGFAIYDISNPVNPELSVASEDISGWSFCLWEDRLLTNMLNNVLSFYDISTVNHPERIATLENFGVAQSIEVINNQACIANDTHLLFIDIENPAQPRMISRYYMNFITDDIFELNNYLMVTSYSDLISLDVSDPMYPIIVDSLDYSSSYTLHGIFPKDEYGIIVDGSSILTIDITEDGHISQEASINTNNVSCFCNYEDYLFIAKRSLPMDFELVVYSIADPTAITLIDSVEIQQGITSMAIFDDALYLSSYYDNDLLSYDISDINNITQIASFHIGSPFEILKVSQNHLYTHLSQDQIAIYDISDPTSPVISDQFQSPGVSYDVSIQDNFIAIADGYYFTSVLMEEVGVQESPTIQPDDFRITNVYPNPFNSQVNIQFTLPERNTIIFSVFDITGRLVDNINRGEMPAGYHTISWQKDNLSSGVYFITLKTGANRSDTRKISYIK